jgi:serine/threonine-protein kinase
MDLAQLTQAILPGTLVAGRYQIQSPLGAGGYGAVYAAQDLESNQIVALKLLHKQYTTNLQIMARFERELAVQSGLHHPNIVKVLGHGTTDKDTRYIVLEYVAGESLAAILERETTLSIEKVSQILTQVASALECAHSAGVIHRDLTPANLLITADGNVKITDFGVAYDLGTQQKLTRTNEIVACTYYSSLEQLMCTKVDETSDLYALGMVGFTMLTGQIPFEADNVHMLRMKHLEEPLPSIAALRPETPRRLIKIIEKLTAKSKTDRYQTATDLRLALAAVLSGPVTADRDATPHRRLLQILVVAALTIITLACSYLWPAPFHWLTTLFAAGIQ